MMLTSGFNPASAVPYVVLTATTDHACRLLRRSSVDDRFQRGGIHLEGDVAVDELYRKDEAEFAALSNQPTFHAAHRAAFDTDPLTFDQARVRLGLAL